MRFVKRIVESMHWNMSSNRKSKTQSITFSRNLVTEDLFFFFFVFSVGCFNISVCLFSDEQDREEFFRLKKVQDKKKLDIEKKKAAVSFSFLKKTIKQHQQKQQQQLLLLLLLYDKNTLACRTSGVTKSIDDRQ